MLWHLQKTLVWEIRHGKKHLCKHSPSVRQLKWTKLAARWLQLIMSLVAARNSTGACADFFEETTRQIAQNQGPSQAQAFVTITQRMGDKMASLLEVRSQTRDALGTALVRVGEAAITALDAHVPTPTDYAARQRRQTLLHSASKQLAQHIVRGS